MCYPCSRSTLLPMFPVAQALTFSPAKIRCMADSLNSRLKIRGGSPGIRRSCARDEYHSFLCVTGGVHSTAWAEPGERFRLLAGLRDVMAREDSNRGGNSGFRRALARGADRDPAGHRRSRGSLTDRLSGEDVLPGLDVPVAAELDP